MSNKKIPDVLYRFKVIELGNGEEVLIKGHRGSDFNILRAIKKIRTKSLKLNIKLSKITDTKNEDGIIIKKPELDYTDEDIDKLAELTDDIDKLDEEIYPLIEQLSYRGLNRYYYPEKKTSELDSIPKKELNRGEILEIHRAMNQLDNPLPDKEDVDTKN